MKATYLLHFLNFTTWPSGAFETSTSAVRLCVANEHALGGALDAAVHGERVQGRAVVVTPVRGTDPLDNCHVLYLDDSDDERELLRRAMGRPLLTVGESAAFWQRGGMLRFVTEGRTIRFDVNLRSVAAANLTLSARLIQVARMREALQ